jgi:hypothetical protein
VFPGASEASIAVTGQTTIGAGAKIIVWLIPSATSDRSIDEVLMEPLRLLAGNIVVGTGFTIYGFCYGGQQPDGQQLNLYGDFTVGWVWYD